MKNGGRNVSLFIEGGRLGSTGNDDLRRYDFHLHNNTDRFPELT
jgi:hypothetical protein